jgi:hypothetical protein
MGTSLHRIISHRVVIFRICKYSDHCSLNSYFLFHLHFPFITHDFYADFHFIFSRPEMYFDRETLPLSPVSVLLYYSYSTIKATGCRDSSVGVATRLQAVKPRSQGSLPAGKRFFFSPYYRDRRWGPHSLLCTAYTGQFSLG